jgi:hypothetical protein
MGAVPAPRRAPDDGQPEAGTDTSAGKRARTHAPVAAGGDVEERAHRRDLVLIVLSRRVRRRR